MYRRVLLAVAAVAAFFVMAMPATASAATASATTWTSCPKGVQGTLPGEFWLVRGMTCRAGKRVRARYFQVSTRPFDSTVRPLGFVCGRSPHPRRKGMVRCSKDGHKVDFLDTKVFTRING